MRTICAICENDTYLDEHHIVSKSCGGNNKKYNKINICPTCHRRVHKGEIILEGHFLTTLGNKLIWHLKGESSITGEEPEIYLI